MGGEGIPITTLRFELFPERSLALCLVEGVANAAELRREVLQQKFEASFLDAAMVPARPAYGQSCARSHAIATWLADWLPAFILSARGGSLPQVADVFHLQAAANKALYADSKDALTTHGEKMTFVACLWLPVFGASASG